MISIQPTLLALALASLLFDVGLGREQLGAVQGDPNRQYELVSDAASCSAVGCEELVSLKACEAASQVLVKKKMVDYLSPGNVYAPWSKRPSNCFMRTLGNSANNGVIFNGNPGPNSAPTAEYSSICNCPATCRPTATCEALQAIVNNKCGSNTGGSTSGGSNSGGSTSGGSNSGGSTSGGSNSGGYGSGSGSNSGGSNSGGSNSGGSNSGGDSTSGGGGGGTSGDTPVNKLINDVTIQIDNNPEDPMVDLTGIYKLKEVEGWQQEGVCSAFKQDPAYLATQLVKKLKDDLAKIGANVV